MSAPNQALREAAQQVPDQVCLMVRVAGTAQVLVLTPPQLSAMLAHSDRLGLSMPWRKTNLPSGPGVLIYGEGLEALSTAHQEARL